MAVGDNYIVNFSEASATLQKQLTKSDLPTIDTDQAKWRILEMFEHVNPLVHLDRIISSMLAHEYLYTRVDFVYTTPEQAKRERTILDCRLRSYLNGFGMRAYLHMTDLKLIDSGLERYKVISKSADYETYTLQRIR